MVQGSNKKGIAVIGVACYYPGASSVRALWENILSRRVQFRRMLDTRLPLSAYYDEDPKAPEKTYGTKAAFIEGFHFDWMKLRIPKQTFKSTDIVHWLALDTALKAFEDAGYQLTDIPLQNTGVIVGNTLTGEQTRSQTLRLRWPYVQKVLSASLSNAGMGVEEISRLAVDMEKIYKSAFYPITEDSLAGGLANTIAGRICNFLNLKGGGYIVDGACSSSLLSVATAANALILGDMDLVLAGGVDVSLDPFELVGFSKAGALAKEKMRVYDQRASGFVPGEGCGFVLLKRLEDAVRDKNYIYATINGWGISSDGKGGIMEPSSSGQALAIERAYKDVMYKPCDLDFVEGHGTGTTKGDRVELEGIAEAVERSIARKEASVRSCGVTSFKSIVGHTKAAAGVGGLIKAVLAVNQRVLPPTANCSEPNEVFNDKARRLYPLIHGTVLPQNRIVKAGISSAGFGGINCHVTLASADEPKEALKPGISERALFVSDQQAEVFVFSSRTSGHLKKVIGKFKEDLRNVSVAEMADLAALLNKKVKTRLPVKAAIVTDSPENLYDALVRLEEEIEKNGLEPGQVRNVPAKDLATHIVLSNAVKKARIGFLYPGQGTQRLNMSRVLVERFSWARDLLDLSKLSLYDRVYKTVDQALTREEKLVFEKALAETQITQPAVVINSLIWTEFLSKLGIEPDCVGGHSLGELTAFYKAGAFDRQSLVKFTEFRGELMSAAGDPVGSMLSLACSRQRAESLVKAVSGNIVVANINSPSQTVISGGSAEIEKAVALAEKEGISARRLDVSNAFHSSYMKAASDKIRSCSLLPRSFKKTFVRVFSCMGGAAVADGADLKEYFSRQVVSPVYFVDLVRNISKECDILIEVGHGRVLSDLAAAINKDGGPLCLPVESAAGKDGDLNRALAELFVRNMPVRWEALYENRLIRTFIPASRKKFIGNQCERRLKIGEQVVKARALDIQSVQPPVENEQAPVKCDDKDQAAKILIDLTHKITGFDVQSISMNSRLLDDLNLDSIKAAELIGQAARMLGVAGQVDPSQISNNTLGQIRDRLQALAAQQPEKGPDSGDRVLSRYQARTWVRNFRLEFKSEEIVSRNINQLKALKNLVFLSDGDEGAIAVALGRELGGAVIEEVRFTEAAASLKKGGRADCLAIVLPRGGQKKELEAGFNPMMERLHEAVSFANSNRLLEGAFVVLLQSGGGYFGETGGVNDIASCCGKALISTLALERPDLKVRVIDMDMGIPDGMLAAIVADELSTYERFSAAGYDARMVRRVPYYENSAPCHYKKRDIRWSDKDVVIVTGGAKGITAMCAMEFARITKARMILIGRSPLPDKKDEGGEIFQTLKKFDEQGLKCQYYQCDVTREADLKKVLQDVKARFGKVTGIVHGAGLNSVKRLKQADVHEAFEESLPKVMGAVNLCKALSAESPKLIMGITSIIGVTGMPGSGWYGFANEVLNLYLQQFRRQHPETQVTSIAYSVWDKIGMGAKLGSVERLAQQGIGAIPVEEGVKRFAQLVENDPGVGQVIVTARLSGLDTWKSRPVKAAHFRFLEKIEYFMSGVELIAQARLNVEDDPYLLDHNWRGSLLFPFVFGLEAMAQAVAQLSGVESFSQIKASDINLERPIPVSQEDGAVIEVHAQALEKETKNAPQKVRVAIYSQGTGFQQPHFSAVFEIGPDIKRSGKDKGGHQKPMNDLGLDMQADIYGPILFQGKMFQCIDHVRGLYYDEKSRKGECAFTSIYHKTAKGFLKASGKFNGGFLTGDPFFIDSMLQSMQLIVAQDACLPNFIGQINIIPGGMSAGSVPVLSRIRQTDPEHYSGDAEAHCKKGGAFFIKGCVLKVLETLPDNPGANDIVDPNERDQAILKDLVVKYERELGLSLPFIALSYIAGLKGAAKETRHKKEGPFLNKVVQAYFKKTGKPGKHDLQWRRNGKPVLKVSSGLRAHVSVAHENGLIVCVVGSDEQAVDVQMIVPRTLKEWESLLGAKKFNIVRQFKEEALDRIGTALWTVSEAYGKATQDFKANDFSIERAQDGEYYIFRNGDDLLVSIVVRFSRGRPRVLTVFLKNRGPFKEPQLNDRFGYGKEYFHFYADYSGPQKQLVTSKKFPVTFKNSKSTSKRVGLSSYFDWMGEVREFSLLSVLKQLADIVETREWGVATNNVKLDIKGELRGGDIVEGKVWLENKVNENVYDLHFEFNKHRDGGGAEQVALAFQRISWVKVLGHGRAKVNVLPAFLKDIMKKMEPRGAVLTGPGSFGSGMGAHDSFGQGESRDVRGKGRLLLSEIRIPTTLEESNLVGNIYFANYPVWVGRATDSYFYNLWPELYTSSSMNSEFVCKKFSIDHLNEAMPFDLITVRVFLGKLFARGVTLEYDIYANNEKKLAVARQSLLWVERDGAFAPFAADIPSRFVNRMIKAALVHE